MSRVPMGSDGAMIDGLNEKLRKRLFMVGQNNRFIPEVQTAKQLIARGVLGDVYHAKTAWTRRAVARGSAPSELPSR